MKAFLLDKRAVAHADLAVAKGYVPVSDRLVAGYVAASAEGADRVAVFSTAPAPYEDMFGTAPDPLAATLGANLYNLFARLRDRGPLLSIERLVAAGGPDRVRAFLDGALACAYTRAEWADACGLPFPFSSRIGTHLAGRVVLGTGWGRVTGMGAFMRDRSATMLLPVTAEWPARFEITMNVSHDIAPGRVADFARWTDHGPLATESCGLLTPKLIRLLVRRTGTDSDIGELRLDSGACEGADDGAPALAIQHLSAKPEPSVPDFGLPNLAGSPVFVVGRPRRSPPPSLAQVASLDAAAALADGILPDNAVVVVFANRAARAEMAALRARLDRGPPIRGLVVVSEQPELMADAMDLLRSHAGVVDASGTELFVSVIAPNTH